MTGGWQDFVYLAIVALFLIWSISRRKKRISAKVDVVEAILLDIDMNLKIIETRSKQWQSKKTFKTNGWVSNHDKTVFLENEVVKTLDETFNLTLELNQRIKSVNNTHDISGLSDMPLNQLRELTLKSRSYLAKWLSDNIQRETMGQTRRNFLGF